MDAAPKEALVHTDGRDKSLIDSVHENLANNGHEVTHQSLNPHDQTPLENISKQIEGMTKGAKSDIEYAVNTLLPGDGGIASGRLDRTVSGGESTREWFRRKLELKK